MDVLNIPKGLASPNKYLPTLPFRMASIKPHLCANIAQLAKTERIIVAFVVDWKSCDMHHKAVRFRVHFFTPGLCVLVTPASLLVLCRVRYVAIS